MMSKLLMLMSVSDNWVNVLPNYVFQNDIGILIQSGITAYWKYIYQTRTSGAHDFLNTLIKSKSLLILIIVYTRKITDTSSNNLYHILLQCKYMILF